MWVMEDYGLDGTANVGGHNTNCKVAPQTTLNGYATPMPNFETFPAVVHIPVHFPISDLSNREPRGRLPSIIRDLKNIGFGHRISLVRDPYRILFGRWRLHLVLLLE